ncbi:MAG TPA: dephospho-CoA kinase [Acidimicrobiales bacterium]|nr:dephospho-CoA kinase [Acidimicrobiales bacterium]
MLAIALTGGIGSGKSAVASRLAERGAVIVDADVIAREVVEPGGRAYGEVLKVFGQSVLDEGGSIDRPALARLIFTDPELRAQLNAVVHPAVGAAMAERLAGLAGTDAVVVLDIPLLVEAGGRDRYPVAGVLVVDAPEETALSRLVEQRGMDPVDAKARIAAQATRAERVAIADHVILNTGTLAELDESVARAWDWVISLRQAA